jgi:hypothetical protein
LAGPHEHECVAGSQVIPDGQSALLLQPQLPSMQTWPMAALLQSTQPLPLLPHAVGSAPAAQWPLLQQPVQVPSPIAPQASVHLPATQVGVVPLQGAHWAPAVPHTMLLSSLVWVQ